MSLQLLIVYAISDFFLLLCMMIFTKRRYGWRFTSVLMVLTYLLALSLETWRYRMSQAGYTFRFTMLLGIVIAMAVELAVSEYRDSRAIFTVLMSGIFIMFGDMAAKVFLSEGMSLAPTILIETAIHVILLSLLVFFMLPSYRKLQTVYRREWSLLSIILLMFYIGMYLLYDCLKHPGATIVHYLIPMAYLMTVYLMVILVFQMLGRLNTREMEEREKQILQASMDALKIEVGERHRAERLISEYNHDSRRFVSTLQDLMEKKDYEGVERTLAEMQSMPQVTSVRHYCRNIPLNGVVSYYVRMAEKSQIQVSVDLETLPMDLGESEWELATVFGNILDNAVQASSKAEPPERKQIRIRGHENGGQILYEIYNTYTDEIVFDRQPHLPVSHKGEGHGFGMRSVAGFVEKWEGTLDCGVRDEWFYVRILI